ncbi:hemin receptor [Pelagibacterium halotolerans]|uniref:hemin receptor n=1 Tax=Pelagibacterium halotolerans TaxID=531813 RepID=UPI0038508A47
MIENKKGSIGPHNFCELELMLEDKKALAVFHAKDGMSSDAVGDKDFEKYVSNGKIIKYSRRIPDRPYELRCYCLPKEEWRAKLIMLVDEQIYDKAFRATFSEADLVRMEGHLLGYSTDDIEFFIEKNVRKRMGKDEA